MAKVIDLQTYKDRKSAAEAERAEIEETIAAIRELIGYPDEHDIGDDETTS